MISFAFCLIGIGEEEESWHRHHITPSIANSQCPVARTTPNSWWWRCGYEVDVEDDEDTDTD